MAGLVACGSARAASWPGPGGRGARALGWAELLEFCELLGGEDFFELRLDVRFQVGKLLLLLGGEFEGLLSPRGQQAGAARPWLLAALAATFRRRGTFAGRWGGRVLRGK